MRLTLWYQKKVYLRVGVWGREDKRIFLHGRLADDGKRIQCDGRCCMHVDSLRIGKGFREGMALGSQPNKRLTDAGRRIYTMDVLDW